MRTDEAILEDIIKDGSVDIDSWPELLKRLLIRLDNIIHTSFPPTALPEAQNNASGVQPTLVQRVPLPVSGEPKQVVESTSEADQSGSTTPLPSSPPSLTKDGNSSPCTPIRAAAFPTFQSPPLPPPAPPLAESQPPATGTLHPEDQSVYNSLVSILTTQFSHAPPHTVQRLAELLRYPNTHYKSLPKYLRALQRVLSVTSPSTSFPLPPNAVDTLATANGFTLGSDESLGGALLTPIPWLIPSEESKESEATGNGLNGVSQGELIRQEQEFNVIPVNQVSSPPRSNDPPALGPADVGPQPEGTVFPDPPRSPEEIGEAPVMSFEAALHEEEVDMDKDRKEGDGREEAMKEDGGKEETGKDEGGKEEEMKDASATPPATEIKEEWVEEEMKDASDTHPVTEVKKEEDSSMEVDTKLDPDPELEPDPTPAPELKSDPKLEPTPPAEVKPEAKNEDKGDMMQVDGSAEEKPADEKRGAVGEKIETDDKDAK